MIDYSIATKNKMLEGLLFKLDEYDPIPSYMNLYTADKPVPGEDITTQTLIATLPLYLPAGDIENGVLTITVPIEEDNAPESGLMNWGRLLSGGDEWIADFDIGLTGSGACIEMESTLLVYQGGIVRINFGSFSI